jgi:hypothetical protein
MEWLEIAPAQMMDLLRRKLKQGEAKNQQQPEAPEEDNIEP